MAVIRTTVLAQGTTGADSELITIDAGATVSIGLFVAAGRIPVGVCTVKVKTPGADCFYEDSADGAFGFSRGNPRSHFTGPLELIVSRPVGMDAGIYKAA